MKPLFNDYSVRTLNRIALPIVIALSVSTALLPFLKATSTEIPQIDIAPFYDRYALGSLFALRTEGNGPSMKKVMQSVLTPVPHRLSAVYSDREGAFVAIDDGSTTTFVNHGMLYKNRYRLVSVSSTSAVLSAYGQRMTLRLGEPGSLSLKETVTAYVPDKTAAAEASNYVLERSTIDRYAGNMGEIWKNITISEVVKNDKTIGFRIDKVVKGTPFDLLGVQNGDIITGIDNKPILSYATAISAYHNGLRRSAIKISILRNNQPKDLEYEISR